MKKTVFSSLLLVVMLTVCIASAESINVPEGTYIVGTHIKAGAYTVTTRDIVSNFELYRGEDTSDFMNLLGSYSIPNGEKVGRVVLKDGNALKVIFGASEFTPYVVPDLSSMSGDFILNQGDYIVGKDLPAGEYTVTTKSIVCNVTVFKTEDTGNYMNLDASHSISGDQKIGRLVLKDGYSVVIQFGDAQCAKFTGL